MKILTKWLRAYLPGLAVDDAQLAEDLTLRGIAVEGIYDLGAGNGSLFEMDITTNRVDAMNHYGVAREAAAIYGLALPALDFRSAEARPADDAFLRTIEAEDACGRFTARVLRGVKIAESNDWFPGAEVATYFGLLEQKQSPTPSTPPTSPGWRWASPRTPSIWTRSRAASWCGAPTKASGSRRSTAWSARSIPKTLLLPITRRRWRWPASWAAGTR